MTGSAIHAIEIIFLVLLLFVVIFAVVAQKMKIPYPIVLVVAGLLLSFLPRVPKVTLNPDVIFLMVLPPLLYSAAWVTSWRDFRFNLVRHFDAGLWPCGIHRIRSGLSRAVRLCRIDVAIGILLGAVVAPTDSIAATSIARTSRCPAASWTSWKGKAWSMMPAVWWRWSSPWQ